MELEGRFDPTDGVVRVAGDARQRFHDARGYGYPLSGNKIALAPVEAAHLLYRGDLAAVVDESDGSHERLDFRAFITREIGSDFGVRFLVYADLRSRGFYLSPAREPWVADPPEADFAVFPRGKGPGDGEIAYALDVIGERTDVPATALREGVLAVVDEESEITYFEVSRETEYVTGSSDHELPEAVSADLLADRVVIWDPPSGLYERSFYGQPLEGREYDRPTLQCSLVEAAYLAESGALTLEAAAVRERGRAVEGDRFDRRLTAYTALRNAGVVPKTGYKFGADFRTYSAVESVENLGHSELLVRVLSQGHVFEPRDLSLDVRLAHGVRKRMVFALVGDGSAGESESTNASEACTWWALERLTP